MAGWRQAVELALSDEDIAALAAISPVPLGAHAFILITNTQAADWWKLTYERSGGIRVLTPLGSGVCIAAVDRIARAYGPPESH
jgi:hypothetical protein